jgi:chromosomal replication initiation ATPase DnaA
MTSQLALNWPTREDYSAESLILGASNAEAMAALERWPDWPRGVMALVGPEGAGKSHIGTVWANRCGAAIVAGADLREALAGLEPGRPLLVEDVDRGVDEDALFHTLNRTAEGGIPALLLTARKPPVLWPAALPDLVSRLRALPHAGLHEADDELLTRLIEKQLQDRGAPVRPGVIDYLLPRMERSVAAVRLLVDRMDKLALVKKTPINRAVAREALETWPESGDAE